jgi:hypothetical protein
MKTSYTIITHNPIILFVIFLPAIFISVYLLQDYAVFVIVIMFAVLAICNYSLGKKIEVEITENGVTTDWATLPFFC